VYGQYRGPRPGTTPQDDSDLHSSGNPFATGAPATDLSKTSEYPAAPPIGYFTNPPASPDNPSHGGSGNPPANIAPLNAHVADGMDACLTDTYNYQSGDSLGMGGSGAPAAVNYDEGFARGGEGRS
jgi:hypothetical protein